jgi:hypothetical protein
MRGWLLFDDRLFLSLGYEALNGWLGCDRGDSRLLCRRSGCGTVLQLIEPLQHLLLIQLESFHARVQLAPMLVFFSCKQVSP